LFSEERHNMQHGDIMDIENGSHESPREVVIREIQTENGGELI
jgi:hypothetical protein